MANKFKGLSMCLKDLYKDLYPLFDCFDSSCDPVPRIKVVLLIISKNNKWSKWGAQPLAR